jgi:hypothetical protein
MRNKAFPLVILVGLFLLPVGVFADSLGTVTFNLYTAGGTESWDPSTTGVLTGNNIAVKQIKGTGTQLNNNVILSLLDGFLSYTTSASSTWGWSTGAFTLTGCIVSTGLTLENSGTCDANNPSNNPVLLSGNLQNVTMSAIGSNSANVNGSINGFINPLLAAEFGLSSSFSSGVMSNNLSSASGFATDNAFTGATNTGGSVAAQAVSVSEDWSVSFGFVFFGFTLGTFGLASRLGALRCRGLLR